MSNWYARLTQQIDRLREENRVLKNQILALKCQRDAWKGRAEVAEEKLHQVFLARETSPKKRKRGFR